MQIKILFDNTALDNRFLTGWGISCLINDKILFDTGEKPDALLKNMKALGVKISNIEAVVISHDHWDHTGGLWEILTRKKGLKVFTCPGFTGEFKDKAERLHGKIIEADKFTEITKNIFVTGEISGTYGGRHMPEQALAVKTKNGITVITGCAHPGIAKIIDKVKKEFTEEKFYLVFGGFHLEYKDKKALETIVSRFKKVGVKKVGPTHCSGKRAEAAFKEKYGGDFIQMKVGKTIKV